MAEKECKVLNISFYVDFFETQYIQFLQPSELEGNMESKREMDSLEVQHNREQSSPLKD